MIELKREINELCCRHGELTRYPLEFERETETQPPRANLP